jgi:hypothetical protein
VARQGTETSAHAAPSSPRLRLGRLSPGRMQVRLGEEAYLWLLVGLEVLSLAWLRHAFRRSHGG